MVVLLCQQHNYYDGRRDQRLQTLSGTDNCPCNSLKMRDPRALSGALQYAKLLKSHESYCRCSLDKWPQ